MIPVERTEFAKKTSIKFSKKSPIVIFLLKSDSPHINITANSSHQKEIRRTNGFTETNTSDSTNDGNKNADRKSQQRRQIKKELKKELKEILLDLSEDWANNLLLRSAGRLIEKWIQ